MSIEQSLNSYHDCIRSLVLDFRSRNKIVDYQPVGDFQIAKINGIVKALIGVKGEECFDRDSIDESS